MKGLLSVLVDRRGRRVEKPEVIECCLTIDPHKVATFFLERVGQAIDPIYRTQVTVSADGLFISGFQRIPSGGSERCLWCEVYFRPTPEDKE